MKNKWLITIDMDGTLLSGELLPGKNDEYHPLMNKVYKEMSELGHKICINTGRSWGLAEKIYKEIGMDTVVINCNGAHIHKPGDDSFPVFESFLNKDTIQKIISFKPINDNLKIISYSHGKDIYINVVDKENELLKKFKESLSSESKGDGPKPIFGFGSTIEVNPYSVMIYLNEDKTILEEVKEYLNKFSDEIYYRFYDEIKDRESILLEISPVNTSKGKAVEYVAEYYGIDMKNTMGFGDGSNDKELLISSEIGVAMKNATSKIKEISNDITEHDNTDGGVAKYIMNYFNLKI